MCVVWSGPSTSPVNALIGPRNPPLWSPEARSSWIHYNWECVFAMAWIVFPARFIYVFLGIQLWKNNWRIFQPGPYFPIIRGLRNLCKEKWNRIEQKLCSCILWNGLYCDPFGQFNVRFCENRVQVIIFKGLIGYFFCKVSLNQNGNKMRCLQRRSTGTGGWMSSPTLPVKFPSEGTQSHPWTWFLRFYSCYI